MGLDEAGRARPKSTIDVALDAGTNQEATEGAHIE